MPPRLATPFRMWAFGRCMIIFLVQAKQEALSASASELGGYVGMSFRWQDEKVAVCSLLSHQVILCGLWVRCEPESTKHRCQ